MQKANYISSGWLLVFLFNGHDSGLDFLPKRGRFYADQYYWFGHDERRPERRVFETTRG
jgi:hypothetical protein